MKLHNFLVGDVVEFVVHPGTFFEVEEEDVHWITLEHFTGPELTDDEHAALFGVLSRPDTSVVSAHRLQHVNELLVIATMAEAEA